MKATTLRGLAPALVLAALGVVIPAGPAAAGGFFWHHGYGRTTVVSGVPTSSLTFVPVSAVPATAAVAPSTIQGLQLVPIPTSATTGQNVQLVPVGASAAPSSGVGVVYVQSAPTSSGLVLLPQNTGVQAQASASPSPVAAGTPDADMAVLAAGFGNRFSKVIELQDLLKGKLGDLLKHSLDSDQIRTLLLDAAKSYMTGQGFGFLINDAVEPILKRMIDQIIQKNTPTRPVNPSPPGGPGQPTTPTNTGGGAQSFTISGTVILTPGAGSGGQPAPSTPSIPPTPSNPPSPSGPNQLTPGPDSDAVPADPPSN